MRKYLLLLVGLVMITLLGCTEDDFIDDEIAFASFIQESVSVSSLGGEVRAIVNWSETEWEIIVEDDNDIIIDFYPKSGGGTGSRSTIVKFICSQNTTGEDKVQEVFVKNLTNNKSSKLLIVQSFEDGLSNGYYVSNMGSDDSEGSRSEPFKTIAKAASVAQPGDTIRVREGVYIEHSIKPAVSGIEGAMIVFKPESSSDKVIIKHPGTSVSDLTPIFDLAYRDFIWIEGFQFKDFKYGKASIFIDRGKENVIINNRFENIGVNEIPAWNATSVIFLYFADRNVIRNNYFDNITGDGIGVNDTAGENLIIGNTFKNFHGMRRAWAPDGNFTSGITCQETKTGGNIFAFNYGEKQGSFIWYDRNGSDNIALRNLGYDCNAFIFNESRCARNVIQENIGYNIKSVAYETARYETGWTEDARWINNVAYNCRVGYYVSKSWRDEFRNNITVNSGNHNLVFTNLASASGPHIFENNLWFSKNKARSIQYEARDITVQTFASQVNELGTISEDPLFVDPQNGDFRLQEASPAKRAADTGIDLGAYAVYPKTEVGWDEKLSLTGNMQVSFNHIISEAPRGEIRYLILDLNKAADKSIHVEIHPVAGDAREGIDFDLESKSVTFNIGEKRKTLAVTFKGSAKHDQLIAFQLNNVSGADIGSKNLHVIRVKKSH